MIKTIKDTILILCYVATMLHLQFETAVRTHTLDQVSPVVLILGPALKHFHVPLFSFSQLILRRPATQGCIKRRPH